MDRLTTDFIEDCNIIVPLNFKLANPAQRLLPQVGSVGFAGYGKHASVSSVALTWQMRKEISPALNEYWVNKQTPMIVVKNINRFIDRLGNGTFLHAVFSWVWEIMYDEQAPMTIPPGDIANAMAFRSAAEISSFYCNVLFSFTQPYPTLAGEIRLGMFRRHLGSTLDSCILPAKLTNAIDHSMKKHCDFTFHNVEEIHMSHMPDYPLDVVHSIRHMIARWTQVTHPRVETFFHPGDVDDYEIGSAALDYHEYLTGRNILFVSDIVVYPGFEDTANFVYDTEPYGSPKVIPEGEVLPTPDDEANSTMTYLNDDDDTEENIQEYHQQYIRYMAFRRQDAILFP